MADRPRRKKARAIAIPVPRTLWDDFTDWMVGEGQFWLPPLIIALLAALAWAASRDQGFALSY
ncbi:MAG: hypothetical protein H6741_23120 [Alphaproteobacteria bacterium]|nr:hypothetical protein [Alphaproteobacteria bacterium]